MVFNVLKRRKMDQKRPETSPEWYRFHEIIWKTSVFWLRSARSLDQNARWHRRLAVVFLGPEEHGETPMPSGTFY